MQKKGFMNKRLALSLVVFLAISVGAFMLFGGGNGAINPNRDDKLNPNDGTTKAAVYNHAELYKAIGESDYVLDLAQKDLLTFARTTLAELKDNNKKVGFTFNKDFQKEGETYIFHGHFYGVKDEIVLRLTASSKGGVYTLSITNSKDGTNIDESLRLNGRRNAFIKTLPINETRFSIRYQLAEDRVVVSFYQGYSAQDVNSVEKLITDGLGSIYNDNVVYSINAKGIFGFDKIRENLTNPIPAP